MPNQPTSTARLPCHLPAIVLAALLGASPSMAVAQAQGPVIASPKITPAAVARALAERSAGTRSVRFSGFATDIANYDKLTTVARAPDGRTIRTKVQSPWLDAGIQVAKGRVASYVREVARAGGVIDSFIVDMPASIAGTRLADLTLPSWRAMSADPRAPALASMLGLKSMSQLGTDRAAIAAWRTAAPARSDAIMAAAVDAAVRGTYPSATGPVRVPFPAIASPPASAESSPTVSATTASPPPPVTQQTPKADTEQPAASAPAAAQAGGSNLPEGSIRAAAMSAVPANTAPAAVLSDPNRGRRTTDWTGQMRYLGVNWAEVRARSTTTPELRQLLFSLGSAAQATMAAPATMFVRPETASEIDTSILDPRAAAVGANREAFALALADCSQANFVRTKGVELAVMAIYANDAQYLARCNEILDAMTRHRPLQRPGWTLTSPSMSMPSGGDGVWLATNWGICGIVDMLSILGDRVPVQTRVSLRALLREEVNRIAQDWADRRPWYVRGGAITSNQWIEPNVGLVKACLYLEDPDLLPAYNLGVENLAMTLEALGADGAFLEGMGYATMTLGPLFDVIADIRANGDRRCNGFPFTDNAWKWLLHMHMPGRFVVNSYDCRMSQLPDWAIRTPMPSWVSAVLATDDPTAVPTMKWFYPSGQASVTGIRYQMAAQASTASCNLPEFAWFPSQQQLTWRSAWQPPSEPSQTSLAVWLRGGTTRESHTHRDQGHVSVHCGSRIVLMDCGTPDYSTPDFNQRYAEAAGHNIMQVAEIRPRGVAVAAPVTVHSLGRDGGSVSIDTRAAYVGVQSCTRDVAWSSAGQVTIDDRVSLEQPVPGGTEFYRFHTGSVEPLGIQGSDREFTVQWRGTTARISADRSIVVSQLDWPDATRAPFRHQVIMIRAVDPGRSLSVRTTIDVDTSVTN